MCARGRAYGPPSERRRGGIRLLTVDFLRTQWRRSKAQSAGAADSAVVRSNVLGRILAPQPKGELIDETGLANPFFSISGDVHSHLDMEPGVRGPAQLVRFA